MPAGGDGLQPFLKDASRGVWVLCKTSNPGAADWQKPRISDEPGLLKSATRSCEGISIDFFGLVFGAANASCIHSSCVWRLCLPGSQDVQALELPNGEPLYLVGRDAQSQVVLAQDG